MRNSKHPLDQDGVAVLRQLIAEHGMRRLSRAMDLDPGALARAAAGQVLLAGTRALVTARLERLRETGELARG
jgi:hypothetical protein